MFNYKKNIMNDKKELIITIAGQTASGKSRLTYLLKKFLREEGFDVELECNIDHPTESNFDMVMSSGFEKIINEIKTTRKIIMKEIQLSHDIIKHNS